MRKIVFTISYLFLGGLTLFFINGCITIPFDDLKEVPTGKVQPIDGEWGLANLIISFDRSRAYVRDAVYLVKPGSIIVKNIKHRKNLEFDCDRFYWNGRLKSFVPGKLTLISETQMIYSAPPSQYHKNGYAATYVKKQLKDEKAFQDFYKAKGKALRKAIKTTPVVKSDINGKVSIDRGSLFE